MTTYKEAGVDIDLADQFVELIKPHAERTYKRWRGPAQIMVGIGGFAAVAKACGVTIGLSTDGVGEKGSLARFTGQLDTIGQDLVAMSANDLWATMEPEEAFFLDYYATGKLSLKEGERLIAGIADACRKCGIALMGGETAEMSLSYEPGEWEMAGFIAGLAKSEDAVSNPKRDIVPGMRVWGFPSSGLHSNGYSLVHKVFGIDYNDPDDARCKLGTYYPELGMTLGEELMWPTQLYTNLISTVRYRYGPCVGGFAHITGGGVLRNLRRILPKDCTAVVNMGTMTRPAIFDVIERVGEVKWLEMHSTFNCGIGLIAVSIADLDREGFTCLGEIKEGNIGDKGLILYSA